MEENTETHEQRTSDVPKNGNVEHSAEFETLSCFFISKDNKARRWMIQLIKWPWFERISMFVIFINCVTLAMYNPLDKDCRSTRCQVLEKVEIVIFSFFSAEMIIKMIAMGVTGKKGYLQDKWNRLDCFIVIIGVIEKAVRVNGNYLTIIRAFRVLRPLRAINKVPSIRILVTLLLDTLPMLGNVLLLSFLIFFVFGIIGVQLWQGKLRNRCFTELPENSTFFTRFNQSQFYQPSFSNPDFVCATPGDDGTRLCSDIPKEESVSTECPNSFGNFSAANNSVPFNWNQCYSVCKPSDQNPFYNTTSFDNIGIAWIAIFQVITLEGWSDIMYFVQDAHSFWNWIYFVVLIVMGSFFLVNLCLVVITMQFQETKAREIELMENSKGELPLEPTKLLKTLIKYIQSFCSFKPQEKEEVHHHHHHYFHHHHFHHHLYNCFVPASPVVYTDHEAASGDTSFFPYGTSLPKIQVEGRETICSHSSVEESPVFQDFLAPPLTRQSSRRSSRTSICSHTLSIHAETSSAVSIDEIVTQAKTSVTLNIPSSPTATFFALSSGNSASRKNSTQSRKSEFSASTLVSAEINPHHARTSTPEGEDVSSKAYKEATKSLLQQKDKELFQYRRFSQPAHAKLARTPSSKRLDTREPDYYRENEANSEIVKFDAKSSLESDLEKSDTNKDPPSKDLVKVGQVDDCQIGDAVNTTLKRPSLQRRNISAQNEDDMFESLFNLGKSATYDVTGNRSAWQRLRTFCRNIIESKQFNFFIMGAILLNMICMGLEHYQQPEGLTLALETINIIFVSIFGMEVVIKLLGYGVTTYLSEGQNVFDGLIVIVSVCEILLTKKDSSLSIFRSIRLLRIFKLVRPVRYQLLVVVKTMTSVMTFFGLLFLFIFAFAILGMNLFGGKFIFKNAEGKEVTSRSNFDNFLWAMVSVFQILTQENWNLVMNDGMRATSQWAALYFIALMAIGYYVLFNLLVAILVEGFTNPGKGKTTPKNKQEVSDNKDTPKTAVKEVEKPHILISSKDSEEPCPGHYHQEPIPEFCGHGLRNALGTTFQLSSNYTPSLTLETLEPLQEKRSPTASQPTEASMTMPQLKRMRQASASIIRKTEQKAHRANWSYDEPNFSAHNRGFLSEDSETRGKLNLEVSEREMSNKACGKTLEEIVSPTIANCMSFPNQLEGPTTSRSRPESPQMIFQNKSSDEMYQLRECHLSETQKKSSRKVIKITDKRSDWSLFLFSPSNSLRRTVTAVCEHKYFDYVVLVFILISCVVLALEEPNIPRDSKKRQIIDIAMLILTVIFTIEMSMKIIAQGFLLGPGTYLKDSWNILDGILVLSSWIDVIITYSPANAPEVLGALKVFRALRTLRPLRMIRRAPGLKLVVQTLLFSLKPIGNTVLIAAIFFVMFGILGVQIFKGKFYYCDGESEVKNKEECSARGQGVWKNRMYNFDNLPHALISLFVFSTRDGWVEIMHHGIDAVGYDQQPIKNYREWRLAYFIPFLMLGGFLVLNMIVGVVVENFQRCRERLEDEEKQRGRRKLLEKAREKSQEEVDRTYYESYSPWRRHIHDMCLHLYWDVAIAIVICLNVLCMSLEHYQMSEVFDTFVNTANYFFASVFVLEVIFKFIAFGFVRYFKDRWNIIDLIIVLITLTGILIYSLSTIKATVPINPTVARSLRVLRIIRVLKLVKLAKGVRSLLDTLFEALPQVANLGLLFLLLFFIYACLGIQLFGTLECTPSQPCQGLGPHAHFKDFGTAMLTLFRIATGDNWNGILEDTLRLNCSESAECEKCCFVSHCIASLFFVTFVLVAQFVLINVVIAVLMKHLKESKEKIAANMAAKDLEKKLKLLTTTAKNFILAKAKRNDLSISRRHSVVQLGLGGIELTQLKHCTPTKNIDSSFRAEFAKADTIFQEFLLLHENLQKVKMTICRTASHNIEVTPAPVTPSLRQRRNSFCGVRELHDSKPNLAKFTVYKSGAKL